MRRICFVLLFLSVLCASYAQEPVLRFGIFADCQYALQDKGGSRRYTLSNKKLGEAISTFNTGGTAFNVSLGDLVDADIECTRVLEPILATSSRKIYHLMGNHDFLRDSMEQHVKIMQLEKPFYYSVVDSGVRLIFLNSTQFDDTQLAWLESELEVAQKSDKMVFIMSHHPIFYYLNFGVIPNNNAVRELLEKYSVVKACFSGHVHFGCYAEVGGIHYLTLKGMLDTDNNRFAIVNVYPDFIKVDGRGDEQDKLLKLIKK